MLGYFLAMISPCMFRDPIVIMTNKNNKQLALLKSNKRKLIEIDVHQYAQSKKKKNAGSDGGFKIARPISVPVGAGFLMGSSRPKIRTYGDEIIRVTNCEQFNSALGSVGSLLVMNQPLIPSVCPWLNGIASNFSKWRWVHCRIIYLPSCPTTATGSITVGIYYDTADPVPATRQQLSAVRDSSSGPMWAGWEGAGMLKGPVGNKAPAGALYADLDTSKLGRPWYGYATGANYLLQSVVDRNIYAPAVAYAVADGGTAGTVGNGTIYIAYDIELIEPITAGQNF